METHRRVVRLLADGALHSGEELAVRLGLSRVAVWKAVRKLGDSHGLAVRSVRGRGYRLDAPLDLLHPERILDGMDPDARARIAAVQVHDDLDSTNSHLMREGRTGAPAGTLCLAERQTAGRGRRGRSWVSPFGTNLYLSLLWRFPLGPSQLGGLSLAAGTAVAAAVRAEGVEEVGLKWPNDLLWRRRKLGGLLVEVAGEAAGPSLVVVGVGINTRLGAAGAGIDQPWADLAEVLGEGGCERNRLAARVAAALATAMDRFAHEGLPPFLPEWTAFDRYRGEAVEVVIGDQRITGLHAGITAEGGLRIETPDGPQTFQAGEVSLRPLGAE
jgi:BirA family biotin operon repressor/biotin-[acetyl-CoA-carboxylase] ligase